MASMSASRWEILFPLKKKADDGGSNPSAPIRFAEG